MKKPKRKKKERIQDYEFTDYAGKKVMTNSEASVHIFGSKEPDSSTVELVTYILAEPDFVFSPYGRYNSYCYFKNIGGNDYVLETSDGYGILEGANTIDISRRAISALRCYEMDDDKRREFFKSIEVIYAGPKYFLYASNLYPS